MDYVFTQGSNHEWYLSALQESEMKPEATATPAPTANVPQDAQSMVEDQLGNAMADTSTVLNDDAASDTSAGGVHLRRQRGCPGRGRRGRQR